MSTSENVFKSILRARVAGAIGMARAANGITHGGIRGRVREILIKDLFKPLLPADIGVSSGQVVACKSGKLSREQDIIIFDKSLLPAMDFDAATAIIPIESVLYTIEVKSRLTKAELTSADASAGELYHFDYLPGYHVHKDGAAFQAVAQLVSIIFALDTDLTDTEHGEVQRYKEIYGERTPYLKAICVASRGYWYERNGCWIKVKGEFEYDEILAFVSGVLNTFAKIKSLRGHYPIGEYLIKSNEGLQVFPSGTYPIVESFCIQCGGRAITLLRNENRTEIEFPVDAVVDGVCGCGARFAVRSGKYRLTDGMFVPVSSS